MHASITMQAYMQAMQAQNLTPEGADQGWTFVQKLRLQRGAASRGKQQVSCAARSSEQSRVVDQ